MRFQDRNEDPGQNSWSKRQGSKNVSMHGSSPDNEVNFISDDSTRDSLQTHFGDQMAKPSAQTVGFRSRGHRDEPCRSNDRFLASLKVNQPLSGELSVSFSNCIEMNPELGCDTSDGWHGIPRRKISTLDVHTNLIHDLPVDWNRRVWNYLKARILHVTTVRRIRTVSSRFILMNSDCRFARE
jgi:hypothetical protein